jgi:hypothetical protein
VKQRHVTGNLNSQTLKKRIKTKYFKMKTKIILLLTLLTNLFVFSQSQFQNVATSGTNNAERVANFSVSDATNELLEITNSTNINGQFIPSLWAHHQADNRFVFRHFITTNSAQDNGTIPMMIYRAEIRDNLNLSAGPTGDFPWGTTAANVVNRPLFAWENGNTQLMRMLANGFLGIGTTTPTALLHTNGTVRFENIPTTTSNTYVLTTDINGNVSRQLATSFGSTLVNNCNTTNFIIKKGATDFTCSQIFDNGIGVGIGTINPTTLFHTNGTLRFQNLADSTSPFKILGTDNTGNVFEYNPSELSGTANNDYDWLRPDGTFASSINDNIYTNGNVGINVTNPTARLNTNGTLKFENLADSTSPFKILGTDTTGNVFEYNLSELSGTASNDYDWLKPDGSFATSINDDIYTNGKVGINTNIFPTQVGDVDVSSYSLFSKGGILTEEVRVALSSEWADFVFKKEYKLESLKNVEKFITDNKHLKGVPSANEVEKNGIELGEMNKILLLKIEELTLYLIEMNKKIESLDAEIEKLKSNER